MLLALPRGGVPVAFEIAHALAAELDVLLVRKISAPGSPELGIGAVVEGEPPLRVLNDALIDRLRVPSSWLLREESRQLDLMARRRHAWCGERPRTSAAGRTVVIVDDGVATGGTMRAALRGIRQEGPRRLVMAVPVGAPDAMAQLRKEADDDVCLLAPDDFQAVGQYYEAFDQTADAEVLALLQAARSGHA